MGFRKFCGRYPVCWTWLLIVVVVLPTIYVIAAFRQDVRAADEQLMLNGFTIEKDGDVIVGPTSAVSTGIDLTDTDLTNAISVGVNAIIGTTGIIDYTYFDVDVAGNVSCADLTTSDDAVVGDDLRVNGTITIDGTTEPYMSGSYFFTATDPDSDSVLFVFQPEYDITVTNVEAYCSAVVDADSMSLFFIGSGDTSYAAPFDTDGKFTAAQVVYVDTDNFNLTGAAPCSLLLWGDDNNQEAGVWHGHFQYHSTND